MLKDFKNLRVTIMGLGLHGGGAGAAQFFARKGAKVLVTDLKKPEQLKASLEKLKKHKNIQFAIGQHRPEDFIKTDLVIKNPAVSPNSRYLEIARRHNVPIDTDIGIFFELCPCPIIGITGTKGKSTTAVLLYYLLSQHMNAHRVCLGGNVRISVLTQLEKLSKTSLCILELSSWQLEDMQQHKKSPQMSLVLNILPDHLNRYPNFQAYIDAKKHIFKYQRKKDTLILNFNDPIVSSFAEEAPGKVVFFGKGLSSLPKGQKGAYLQRNKIYYGDDKEAILSLSNLQLKGEHNYYNVLAALTVAKAYNLPNTLLRKALQAFKPIEGRLELVADYAGVKFYNDTAATIPNAVIAALNALSQKSKRQNIILIAGGEDKGLDYKDLAGNILQKSKKLILLDGSASSKLFKELEKQAGQKRFKQLVAEKNIESMDKAVSTAFSLAQKGDIILLSPGAASFNLFANEFDRGSRFQQAIQKLPAYIKRKKL